DAGTRVWSGRACRLNAIRQQHSQIAIIAPPGSNAKLYVPSAYDIIIFRSWPLFEGFTRRAQKEIADNPLAFSNTESGRDVWAVRRPACKPAPDKTMRMRGVEQVHADRARGHLLLPDRDFRTEDRGRDQHEQGRRLVRDLVECRKIHACRAWIFCHPRAFEQGSESLALIARDRDDPPGRKLSVIGRAQRKADNLPELVGTRPGRDHVARFSRAARGEVGAER